MLPWCALFPLLLFSAHSVLADAYQQAHSPSYFSVVGGSGITHIESASSHEQKRQQLRSFDVRFGERFHRSWRADFVHANEGHPYNHHRDGFAVQAVYLAPLSDSLRFELGSGPYASFDTTIDESGVELNEKRLGLMSTAAMVYSFSELGSGAHLRLQWNNYLMAARPNGNSLLLGFGVDFDGANAVSFSQQEHSQDELWLSAAHVKINHGGPDTTRGYSVEWLRRFGDGFAWSLGWLDEGGDNGSTDRYGATAQLWKLISLGSALEGRFGLGPYFAKDKYEHSSAYDMKGVISIGLNYHPQWLAKRDCYIAGSLTRVIDRKAYEDDADVARLSLVWRI